MRITFVMPHAGLAGGIRVVAIYAERLRKRGHEVVAVSVPRKQFPLKGKIKSVLSGRGWPNSHHSEPSYFAATEVDHRVLARCRPVEDSDVPDADVVIATWWETAEWVQRLSPRKGAKVYFIQHYEAFPGIPKDRVDATWRAPLHKIVISRWLLDLARQTFEDPNVSHVPNSVDTEQFWSPPRGKQARATVGLLYSSVAWKGVDASLEALRIVQARLPNLKVVAFGAENEMPSLLLPKGTSFNLRPAQDRIKDIYSACDVWICGSRMEGFHLPPLEAMACRCPVVSTRVGGPLDIIKEGVNGFLVDIDDIGRLAEQTERVLKLSNEEWRKMSDAALATATQYTWDEATELYERALSMAVEQNDKIALVEQSHRRSGGLA